MRLWHYDMLDVLPKKQLVSQWREVVCISVNIHNCGSTKSPLVEPILNYPIDHFRMYCKLVYDELVKRGIHLKITSINKLSNTIGFNPNEERYLNLFSDWHNKSYLRQCYYNLEEKYMRGMIKEEEWLKIFEKYKQFQN